MAGRDLIFTILGIDKGSPAFEKFGRSVEQTGDRLDKFGNSAIKSMAGAAAASVASGVAVGAAVAAVPVLFAGMAAAALASNEEVSTSFGNLASNVVEDVKDIAAPLQDDLIGAANDFGRAWQDVYPQMRKIFADPAMGKGVRELSGGVSDLARNAMPGLLTTVQRSGPVMVGFHRMLGDVGTGVSDMLTNMSESSEEAGVVVTGFGGIVRTTLGDLGGVLGSATSAIAPQMGKIETLVDRVTGSVRGLADGALPVLTHVAGSVASGLGSVLGVLEPISGQLGTGLGVVLAAAGGWRVLSAATGAYTKLDLGGKLTNHALSAGVFAEALTGSATAGERVATAGSRFGTVLKGLGSALPYVGIGVAALGIVMDATARSAQELSDRASTNATELLKGGSAADRTRQHLGELMAANADYLRQQEEIGQKSGDNSDAVWELQKRINANRSEIEQTTSSYEAQKKALTGSELAQVKYNEAVDQFGAGSKQATEAGISWRAALDADRAKQDAAAAATKTHTEKMLEQQGVMLSAVGAGLNYEASLLSVESAHKALVEATRDHGAASLEARQADNNYQQQLYAVVTAIGEKTKAESAALGPAEQTKAVAAAQATEILRLAAAAGDSAPPSLMKMVASLDTATLSAIGVTGRVNEAGDAVLRLPDGKEVVITGDNGVVLRKIQEINDAQLVSKTLWINAVVRQDSKTAVDFGGPGRARGGRVEEGQAVTVGEEGRERWVPDDGAGYMIPHTQTQALERARRMDQAGLGGGTGGGDRHFHLTVYSTNTDVDLLTQFARLEAMEGW
jgi:hypothetical protein